MYRTWIRSRDRILDTTQSQDISRKLNTSSELQPTKHNEDTDKTAERKETDKTAEEKEEDKLTKLQAIAFYMPDLAVFVNNLVFNMMIYVVPVRMVEFNDRSLNSAVLAINLIINSVCLISSIVLGQLTKRVDVIMTMLVGNAVFYGGCILVYGSTTEFLAFPVSFEIGCVLIGIGDASIVNLCIVSKLVLYKKWGASNTDLGKHATTVFNATMCLSAVLGTVVSGLTTTRDSEIPTLACSVAALVVVTVVLTFCRLVK